MMNVSRKENTTICSPSRCGLLYREKQGRSVPSCLLRTEITLNVGAGAWIMSFTDAGPMARIKSYHRGACCWSVSWPAVFTPWAEENCCHLKGGGQCKKTHSCWVGLPVLLSSNWPYDLPDWAGVKWMSCSANIYCELLHSSKQGREKWCPLCLGAAKGEQDGTPLWVSSVDKSRV